MIKEYIEKRKPIVEALLKRQQDVCDSLENKRNELDHKESDLMDIKKIPKPKFFDKFFKTKKYKLYKDSNQKKEDLEKEIKELKYVTNADDIFYMREYYELDSLQKELDILNGDLSIREMLEKLELSFKDIIKFLCENGVPFIFTEEEKNTIREMYGQTSRNFESINDIVLVHKTDYEPDKNCLNTDVSMNAIKENNTKINARVYPTLIRPFDNTIHFSVNNESIKHLDYKWDNKKYGIIVNLADISIDSLNGVNSADTYTTSIFELPKGSIILCPADRISEVFKNNNNCIVIGYENENYNDYINTILMGLELPVEKNDEFGFKDDKVNAKYKEILTEAGYKNFNQYWQTDDKKEYNSREAISIIQGILEFLISHPEFKDTDYKSIIKDNDLYLLMDYVVRNDYTADFGYSLDEIHMEIDIYSIDQEKELSEALIEAAIKTAQKMSSNKKTKGTR